VVPLLLAAAMLLQCGDAPDRDPAREREEAIRLVESGAVRDAIAVLREAVKCFPDDPVLPLLLARAYLTEGNLFWAERTLGDALARRPDDAALRAWLASVHLRQGDPDLAAADLAGAEAPAAGPSLARWHLAEALASRVRGDDAAARAALDRIGLRPELYPEDRPLRRMLGRQLDVWWLDPVSGAAELGFGSTSNALAGSPTDPGRSGGPSALGELDVRARVAPPAAGAVRAAFDLELDGERLEAGEARELSSLTGALRMGALLTRGQRRLLAAYRSEVLLLDQDDSRYAAAQRGELELEWSRGWVAGIGTGRRSYRDEGRTRWEGDVSFGAPIRMPGGAQLVTGMTVRLADARSPAWDQRGVAVVAAARFALGKGFASRVALSGSWEDYHHSGGPSGLLAFGTADKRRDLLGRLTLAAIGPAWRSVQPALEWRLTRRDSNADDLPGFDFDYRESRVTLTLRWRFAGDPWTRRAALPHDHVALDWGLESGEGGEQERILDLLRQDEELRRGSSCGI